MLTKGDDYPIHQTPDPIAYAGTDRNFYDRYFFNGCSASGELFFGAALGVYPHLNIMDAAFAVRIGSRQYNLHASRHLNMERMDTAVGPIAVQVIEPLKKLRVLVDDAAHGVSADVVFEGRSAPIEEPRVTRRNGPRTFMDITRLTQVGRYSGWIRAGGREVRLDGENVSGVRDRSWGVRNVGTPDPQPAVPPQAPQFYWLWMPMNFEDRGGLFYLNEDADGKSWNEAFVLAHDDGRVEHLHRTGLTVNYQPGTRWPTLAVVKAANERGGQYVIEFKPGAKFFMTGLGYMNAEWSHGINKGPLAVGYDEIAADEATAFKPPHVYTQMFSQVTLTTPEGQVLRGNGALESLSFGPHKPNGFTGTYDAP